MRPRLSGDLGLLGSGQISLKKGQVGTLGTPGRHSSMEHERVEQTGTDCATSWNLGHTHSWACIVAFGFLLSDVVSWGHSIWRMLG